MNRLYVIRHGETDWNRERRIQGSSDVHLNDLGRSQAAAMAAVVARELMDPVLVSSPLMRAMDTAAALAAASGAERHVDARLAERSYGVWEGLTAQERREAHPEATATWEAGREPQALDGYEYHHSVAARTREAFDEWSATTASDLVFVTHGSAGRMLILDLLGLPHDSHAVGFLGNCTWSVVRPVRDGAWTLLEHNRRAAD